MKRKIYDKLVEWKHSANRKPLIIQGARQIGKTYLIEEFGSKEFKQIISCNFEKDKNLAEIFNNPDPKTIIEKLELFTNTNITPETTLIFLDEIQECPTAITSLKYFNEQANQYYIIASGSLIGVTCDRKGYSFPVGKVNFLDMYPMDFEEYLIAQKEDLLIKQIKMAYSYNTPLEKFIHERALKRYREYLFVGGMPEVVQLYVDTNNTDLVREKQNEIIRGYINDMTKNNSKIESLKTINTYESISKQLAKENKKFQYADIKHGARSREYEWCIKWIGLSRIGGQVFKLDTVQLPLKAYSSTSSFKIYDSDVGLCCAKQNINFKDILAENPLLDLFKGGLTENYVFNELKVHNFELYYWTNKYDAEVDFITRIGENIIPIEVKSNIRVISKSLNSYIKENKPSYSIRISAKNFGFEGNIKSIPLYAVFCLER